MLPEAVEDAVRGIAEDRTSGASRLGRLALDTMALAIVEARGRPDAEQLAVLARLLSEAQPAMAIVHNVAHLVARLVAEGLDPKAVLRQIGDELDAARERIGRTFLKIVPEHATIVTLSNSENVLHAITAAHARGHITQVFVMESRPGSEGRTLAKALSGAGVPAEVIADDAAPAVLDQASCALVGADSVLRDGAVINKVGTHRLAVDAEARKKPFYVACETLKFDARYDAASWPGSLALNSTADRTGGPDHAGRLRRVFDVTPGRLIALVATERGAYAPDVVRIMLEPGRNLGV